MHMSVCNVFGATESACRGGGRELGARVVPQAGIKSRCLAQFESVSPEGHHRVSRWFLDSAYPENLRAEVEQMGADGSGMTPRLRSAVEGLAAAPLDDCVCEGPHAAAKRAKMPATAAKWAWVASTLRIKQNLADCSTLPAATATSLQAAWSSWATVVQPPSKATRFPRFKMAALKRRVYQVDHLRGFTVPRFPAAILDGVAEGGGDHEDMALATRGGEMAPMVADEKEQARDGAPINRFLIQPGVVCKDAPARVTTMREVFVGSCFSTTCGIHCE